MYDYVNSNIYIFLFPRPLISKSQNITKLWPTCLAYRISVLEQNKRANFYDIAQIMVQHKDLCLLEDLNYNIQITEQMRNPVKKMKRNNRN